MAAVHWYCACAASTSSCLPAAATLHLAQRMQFLSHSCASCKRLYSRRAGLFEASNVAAPTRDFDMAVLDKRLTSLQAPHRWHLIARICTRGTQPGSPLPVICSMYLVRCFERRCDDCLTPGSAWCASGVCSAACLLRHHSSRRHSSGRLLLCRPGGHSRAVRLRVPVYEQQHQRRRQRAAAAADTQPPGSAGGATAAAAAPAAGCRRACQQRRRAPRQPAAGHRRHIAR